MDDSKDEHILSEASLLTIQKHVRYCQFHLQILPTPYESEDCSRMSLAFFVLSSLDLLNATDKISPKDRQAWIDWIYEQQSSQGGFTGGSTTRLPSSDKYDTPHLAMTYTALCNLAILKDDFSRLDKQSLQHFVQSCQTEDGAFSPYPGSPEKDIRFVYCAFAIRHFLGVQQNLFRVNSAVRYILDCRSHDGAFGQNPGLEGQGGTTYCAIASLYMAKALHLLSKPEATIRWLSQRLVQVDTSDAPEPEDLPQEQRHALMKLENEESGGFQGRPEKDADVCYSFWVGAALQLLNTHLQNQSPSSLPSKQEKSLLSLERFQYFLLAAQSTRGGISKYFEEPADVYHTYLGLAGLAVGQYPALQSIRPELNIGERAASVFPLS